MIEENKETIEEETPFEEYSTSINEIIAEPELPSTT